MENDKSSDSIQEKPHTIQNIQEFVLDPTENLIDKVTTYKDWNPNQIVLYGYLQLNKSMLELTKNDIKNNRFPNYQLELEKIKGQMEANIAFLQKPMDDFEQKVKDEIKKINIARLNKNCLTSKKVDSPFDKIVLAYEDIVNDETYGKLIRDTLIILDRHHTEYNITQMAILKDQLNKLKDKEEHIDEHMQILVDLKESGEEELQVVRNSLKILIEELELYLMKRMMENTKSDGTSSHSSNYDSQLLQEYVIDPTIKIIEMFPYPFKPDYQCLYNAYYYLKINENHLDILEDGMKNGLFANDEMELKKIQMHLKVNIIQLKEPLDNYRKSVEPEINEIDIARLMKNVLSSEKHELPFDHITWVYDIPTNDLNYGKVIRSTLLTLEKNYEVNDNSQISGLEGKVNDLENKLENVNGQMKFRIWLKTNCKEELTKAKESLEILINIVKTLIESHRI